eukprot:3737381-Pyramimonas_sp.AAC.2
MRPRRSGDHDRHDHDRAGGARGGHGIGARKPPEGGRGGEAGGTGDGGLPGLQAGEGHGGGGARTSAVHPIPHYTGASHSLTVDYKSWEPDPACDTRNLAPGIPHMTVDGNRCNETNPVTPLSTVQLDPQPPPRGWNLPSLRQSLRAFWGGKFATSREERLAQRRDLRGC